MEQTILGGGNDFSAIFNSGARTIVLDLNQKGQKLKLLKKLLPGISAKDLSQICVEATVVEGVIYYRAFRTERIVTENNYELRTKNNRYNNLEKGLNRILKTKLSDSKFQEAQRFLEIAKQTGYGFRYTEFLAFISRLIDISEMRENLKEMSELFEEICSGETKSCEKPMISYTYFKEDLGTDFQDNNGQGSQSDQGYVSMGI